MFPGIRRLVVSTLATTLLFSGALTTFTVERAAAVAVTRFVAPTGSDASNTCAAQGSPCATLGHALTQAVAGDTVQLEPGTYLVSGNPTGTANTVKIAQSGLTIQSDPVGGTAANTIVDGTDVPHGIVVNANGVTIKNITVRNADQQGILVTPPSTAHVPASVSNLTLSGNLVTKNDACMNHPTRPVCPSPDVNDDYGEAIQLLSVVHSTITNNTVTNNVGGILVTDEMGPNHDNTITGNTVSNNKKDCGITLAGHSGNAVAMSGANAGKPQPTLGGIYHNTVTGNTANGNGAAGILIAAGGPGAGAYSNTVTGNTANENGQPGITLHSHTPFQVLNNNVITGNTVVHDALSAGNDAGTAPGDSDAGVTKTTGIIVFTMVVPVNGTVITGNHISNVAFGIWMSAHTPSATVSGNTISVTAGGVPIAIERTSASIVGITRSLSGRGYALTASDGDVLPLGDAGYFGSLGKTPLAMPVVGAATTPSGNGYWLTASDGGVFSFGDAKFFGSTGA
ncbi:MAG: hypothetical protein QOI55_506, partial [Actinomycetota bacterium]|nr:hypothetical protein [Actinomycetota bacterium]